MRPALRNCGIDGLDDLEVVRRSRVCIRHLYLAIPVAGPDLFARRNQDAVWSLAIRRRRGSVARTCEAGNPADKQIILGIDYVDAQIGSVRQVKSFRLRIDPGDVRA